MDANQNQSTKQTFNRFEAGILILIFSLVFIFETGFALGCDFAATSSGNLLTLGFVLWGVATALVAVSISSREYNAKPKPLSRMLFVLCLFLSFVSFLGMINQEANPVVVWLNAGISLWWLCWVVAIELRKVED